MKYVNANNSIGIIHNNPFLFFILLFSFKIKINNAIETVVKIKIDIPGVLCQKSIDFNKVNSVLSVERKKTIQFLIENCK